MFRLLCLLLLMPALPAQAVELFGVDLASATREDLRMAVKKSGARLLREAGEDVFFDAYEGDTLLHNARRLYLGFSKKDQRFAFVEYEFIGLNQPAMLARLIRKYGQPRQQASRFISDFDYTWQVDGVQIRFYQDWSNYRTRLSYLSEETLQQLRAEQTLFEQERRAQSLIFNEKAY